MSNSSAGGATEELRASPWRRFWRSPWAHLLAALLLIALVQGFVVKQYRVPSGSMEPTLQVSDRMLVNRMANSFGDPGTGDVIVFNQPASWGDPPERSAFRLFVGWVGDFFGFGPSNHHALVKRIVAGPGQTVRCCDVDGAIIVDGESQPLPDPSYDLPWSRDELDCDTEPASLRCFQEFTVPEGEYFVLGDHRSNSADSLGGCRTATNPAVEHCVRLVPREDIVGEVQLVFWPLSRMGSPDPPGVSAAD